MIFKFKYCELLQIKNGYIINLFNCISHPGLLLGNYFYKQIYFLFHSYICVRSETHIYSSGLFKKTGNRFIRNLTIYYIYVKKPVYSDSIK